MRFETGDFYNLTLDKLSAKACHSGLRELNKCWQCSIFLQILCGLALRLNQTDLKMPCIYAPRPLLLAVK